MDFWDKVDWKEFLIPVNTIAEPPAAMLVELARAKLTVVRAANDATSQGKEEESTRARELLLAMDAMILQKPGMKRGGRNSKGQRTVARAISSRLRQFWDGDWDAMLREVTEAAAAGKPRRTTPTIEDEARRIRGLMDIGELRRATAQVTDPAQIAEGGGVAAELKEMVPGGRRYQAPNTGTRHSRAPGKEHRATGTQGSHGECSGTCSEETGPRARRLEV